VTSGHGRFESLCGAIALGEATPAERDEFARHAADCGLCSSELVDSGLVAAIASHREAETWRPSVDRRIFARIHDAQSKRSRFTVGLLAWAAGASILINIFFVTGFAGKLGSVLLDATAPASSVASAQYGVRLPAQTFATIKRRMLAPRLAVHVEHRAVNHWPPRSVHEVVDPPDVFAGTDLAVRDPYAARDVAIQSPPLQLSP
jgi:uncharacterized membrane protein